MAEFNLGGGPTVLRLDLTGVNPNPSVEFDREGPMAEHTHGGIGWTRGYGAVRFDCSILGANPESPVAVPGSHGSLIVRLGESDLRRLRDALDEWIGLADEADSAQHEGGG